MRRDLVIGLLGAAVVIIAIAFWPRSPLPPPPGEEADREGSRPAEAPLPVPEAPRALPVKGLVLDSGLSPLTGVEVVCGEEKAVSGADGAFEFPAAIRPGRRPLAVRRDGEELARWEEVVTGEAGDGPGGGSLRPEMVRWTITIGPRPEAPAPPGSAPPPGNPSIEMTATIIEEWGSTGEAMVRGKTSLPDGAHIQAAFYLEEERQLASIEDSTIAGGAFLSRIRFPEDFRIHPAAYDLHLVFGVTQEDPVDVERWRGDLPSLPEELEVVRKVFAGTLAEEQEENRRIERHFREVLDSVDRLRKVLLASARKARGLAGRWDPAVLAVEVELEKTSFAGGLLDPSGKFDFEGWRRFLDEGWRPEVARLLELHSRRRCGKFSNAESLLESVLKRVLRLSRIESAMVYSAWGQETHPNDFYLDEETPEGDEAIVSRILQRDLSLLRKYRDLTGKEEPADPEPEDQSSR